VLFSIVNDIMNFKTVGLFSIEHLAFDVSDQKRNYLLYFHNASLSLKDLEFTIVTLFTAVK
jgi:hypothetical protein